MRPLTVLYVDDDPDIRDVAVLSLELDAAMTVVAAESGARALAALDEGLRPDVILLDVMMPDLDGPGALAKIRERPSHAATPVVFITARALPNEQARLMGLGATGVITKPFDPITLAGRVRALIGAE